MFPILRKDVEHRKNWSKLNSEGTINLEGTLILLSIPSVSGEFP